MRSIFIHVAARCHIWTPKDDLFRASLEGLLYNVPVDKFGGNYGDSFVEAFNWIRKEADKDKLVCANEQYYLLRDNALTCWEPGNCKAFLDAAAHMWSNWGK